MDRTQFLETLRSQLAGQMHEGKVAAHVRYYEDYIQSQVRSGRSEAEVLAQLGDPRLIAKTLLDTDADSGGDIYEEEAYSGSAYSDRETSQGSVERRNFKLDLSTWYGKAIVIVIAVVAIIALVTIIGAVLPFFLILGIILFVISRVRRM